MEPTVEIPTGAAPAVAPQEKSAPPPVTEKMTAGEPNKANPSENGKPETTKINNPPENQIDPTKAIEKIEAIVKDPEYQKIIDRITAKAKAEGKILNENELHIQALSEYAQQVDKVTEETEKEQEEPLSKEQKNEISKNLKKIFKENPDEMSEVTKKAVLLAKAEANEIKLKEKQNATDKQKAKASEATAELKRQYILALQKLNEALGGKNPQLIKYLQEAPGSPDILKMLKKEKRSSLFQTIMEFISAQVLSVGKDAIDDVGTVPEH
jgi:hypothetical protein